MPLLSGFALVVRISPGHRRIISEWCCDVRVIAAPPTVGDYDCCGLAAASIAARRGRQLPSSAPRAAAAPRFFASSTIDQLSLRHSSATTACCFSSGYVFSLSSSLESEVSSGLTLPAAQLTTSSSSRHRRCGSTTANFRPTAARRRARRCHQSPPAAAAALLLLDHHGRAGHVVHGVAAHGPVANHRGQATAPRREEVG